MTLDPIELGQRIRQARERRGLSQEEFAAAISKDQRAISEYEHGKRRISVTDLPLIARVLNVPLLYFFQDELSTQDFDSEILRHFQQLDDPRDKQTAVALLKVFVEAITAKQQSS